MCYHLWIVSPLSLTEIRSMLPPGFSAEVASVPDQTALRPRLQGSQTVGRLRIGGCACLLRVPRGGDDERHLRRRYAALSLPRDRIIAALERHRRGAAPPGDPAAWRAALAAFVAEHARNAGPTLYYLAFTETAALNRDTAGASAALSPSAVRAAPDTWLPEGVVMEVSR